MAYPNLQNDEIKKMQRDCIIATRKSPLAIWQANWVKQSLEQIYPNISISLLALTTTADRLTSSSLMEVGGKGLFVKELEEALLDKRADIAVHSMKDVPITFPEGLVLSVICERHDARDVFISNHFPSWKLLPSHATVGTSSLRRQSQFYALRSDVKIIPLRGNVHSRLERIDNEALDGIILAAAGLQRLNLHHRIQDYFTIQELLPAAGQGALGIECRQEDEAIQKIISPLQHTNTSFCVIAERAMCKALNGNCQTPIGAYAEIEDGKLFLQGIVASRNGQCLLRAERKESLDNAETLGKKVADDLLNQGAGELLCEK